MRIVLGVTGGIAAYKAAYVLRLLREAGHRVRVVPTEAALRMVGRPTWEALSGEPVRTGVFDDAEHVDHVALGRGADLVIVAPATANLLAKAAAGLADDLLSTTLLTVTCPVLLAPAMHTEMWLNPATQANVATLRARGVHVLDPDSGRLTGADSGPGRLPEPAAIVDAALALVGATAPAASRASLSSRAPHPAAPARRPRRPRRPCSSSSPPAAPASRSTPCASSATAPAAGRAWPSPPPPRAAAPASSSWPPTSSGRCSRPSRASRCARWRPPRSCATPCATAATGADVVIMAAAVADFRPAASATHKIKKTGAAPAPIELVQNPDILAELAADRLRPGQVVVGFAAETGDSEGGVLEHGREKARRKGADLLAVNEVGTAVGFGDVPNAVTVLDAAGDVVARAQGSKADVAEALLDAVAERLRAATTIDR